MVLGGPDERVVPLTLRSYGTITGTPLLPGNHRMTSASLKGDGPGVRDVIMAPTSPSSAARPGAPIVIAPGGSAEAVQALAICEANLLKRIGSAIGVAAVR